jgi:ABC-type multidrug transport system ATPase subunit
MRSSNSFAKYFFIQFRKLLTGQLAATSGEISLPPNYDLISGFKNFQEKVGLCSQQNILIPNLTAKEHLDLYAKIKMQGHYREEVRR